MSAVTTPPTSRMGQLWRKAKRHSERWLRRHYRLANLLEERRFGWRYRTLNEPILIYQMGKVGSSTIVASLHALDLPRDLFQLHFLSDDWVAESERVYRHIFDVTGRAVVEEHLLSSRLLRRALRRPEQPRWTIISLTREPVARNISAFFHAFHLYFPEYGSAFRADPANVEALIQLFLQEFEHEQRIPLDWFEVEMKQTFGIDVFESTFPAEEGYRVFQGERADLIVIRLEDLGRCGSRALSSFLDLPTVTLLSENVASEKRYSSAYRLFRQRVALPDSYLDRMYDSRYATHFYRPEELSAFRQTWSRTEQAGEPVNGKIA